MKTSRFIPVRLMIEYHAYEENDIISSAYGPQLGHRLQLSYSEQNLVGLSGTRTTARLCIQRNKLIDVPSQSGYMGQHHSSGNLPTQEDHGYLCLSPLCCF